MTNNSNEILRLVKHLISAWSLGDVDETMRYMAANIDYFVNVDPRIAPFAASAMGAGALRKRLQLLFNTFDIEAFFAKDIKISDEDPAVARVNIAYFYRERTTREYLEGRFRFIIRFEDGKITQIEEIHDSSYVEAFARLVGMMRHSTDGTT